MIADQSVRNLSRILFAVLLFFPVGCSSIKPTGAKILEYHSGQCLLSIEEFTKRLYLKNPKYEMDRARRQEKLNQIFAYGQPSGEFSEQSSDELLTAAFAGDTVYPDRVYLLGLGLVKSIREAYGLDERKVLVSGLQIPLEHLERLHYNISQVNWRLKTYKDEKGHLIFLTNEAGENGYINMGYEVIMTEILTRIKDDIYLRGGLPGKYIFNMSTLFLTILL
jgi:hypothetical protein